ncbi:Trigger factor [Rosistilla carotiformis]|uniref:Trigger factor n=1 Tax=Rosistilla carotiformis TaxID=2528017 RepID=A0A518JP84_9BACT|nr:trigger factor [Rosistilla carotiformis]QDV67357.1 Trigger factor [Rosistilla carotiformis]
MSTTDAPNSSETTEDTKLTLTVAVDAPQTCLRHVVVTVSRADVERYLKNAYDDLAPEASVPGFRAGRAPRKLVEKQFKDRVADQVKGQLLMDSLAQVTEEQAFSAISEPDFDFESVELPESGDFRFEFKVEVRPEFDTPEWKGLSLTEPDEQVDDEAIDASIARVMSRYSKFEAVDDAAKSGDRLLVTATFRNGSEVLSEMEEEHVELGGGLSFPDGRCEDFGKLMEGVREGESRTGKVTLSQEAHPELGGKEVEAEFKVVEVSRNEAAKLTPAVLEELGDFETEAELREFISESLQRQIDYRRQRSLRSQITKTLTADANWELPPDLVRRQTRRELERQILEMRRSGFQEEDIRNMVNMARQNAQTQTEAALREHFILEKIADDQDIDAAPSDYDDEIALIAEQSDQPERRVRARLEKTGQMDALRNQIVERKVIEMITADATVSKEKAEKKADGGNASRDFAVDHSLVPAKDELPEAKYDDKTKGEASETPTNKS